LALFQRGKGEQWAGVVPDGVRNEKSSTNRNEKEFRKEKALKE